MKNHFSLKRFGLLFRKHSSEHIKTYLMSLVVLVGSLTLVMGGNTYMSPRPLDVNTQSLFYAFFLIGAGTIFTSTVFSNLSGKSRAIATLMLPASLLEKYLVGWIYSFVLFLPVFTGIFYLVDNLVLSLDAQDSELLNIFTYHNLALAISVAYAFMHGVAIWGAIAFEKLSFIKTAFGFFVLVLLLTLLNNTMLEWMLGRDLDSTFPFATVIYRENNQHFFVNLEEEKMGMIELLMPLSMAFILWLAAFMRLKEKEI